MMGMEEFSGFYNSSINLKSFFKVKKKNKGCLKIRLLVFVTMIYLFHIKPMPLIGFNYRKVLLQCWLRHDRGSCTPAEK